MTTVETIKNEIIKFELLDDYIAVEFDDYILEVDKADVETIDKDTLANVIFEKYRD